MQSLNELQTQPATFKLLDALDEWAHRLTAPAEGKVARFGLSLLDWSLQRRRIDDQEFSFERFKPLEALYKDEHKQIVVMKPAQVGISEWAVNYAIWAMDEGANYWGLRKEGINVAYCFPTKTALSDFSKERVSGLIHETPYLQALFSGANWDDVGFKQIAASYLYLRGAWSVSSLLSFAADLLILDEFDQMNTAAVQLARKRLRQSAVKRELNISTPTIPGHGVDAAYQASDKRVWEVLCGCCETFNELNFFRDVRMTLGKSDVDFLTLDEDADPRFTYEQWRNLPRDVLLRGEWIVACPLCKQEVDRCGAGRWTITAPEVTDWHGYHIPALSFPVIELAALAVNAVDPDPTVKIEFYRSDLGIPFEPEGSRITLDMILRLSAPLDASHGMLPVDWLWSRTTMGVDVGGVYNYKITSTGPDGRRYVRWMGEAKSWDELSIKMREYSVLVCVVDALPETHGCKGWADTFPGRVYRAYYPNMTDIKGQLFRSEIPDAPDTAQETITRVTRRAHRHTAAKRVSPTGLVHINRTMAMDAVYAMIANGEEVWPGSLTRLISVQEQMTAPVRIVSINKYGQELAQWAHTTPDHYFHSSVYCLVAERMLPQARSGIEGVAMMGKARGWSLT